MNSRKRLVVIIAILCVLSLSLWGSIQPALAGDSLLQGTGCITGLSAADCKLFKAASAATPPETFELGYDLKFKLTGKTATNLTLTLKGTGPFDASRVDGNNLTAVVKGLTLSNSGTLSYSLSGRSNSQPLELRFVDGTMYFNTPLTAGADGMWYKLALDTLLEKSDTTFDLNSMNQFVHPDSMLFGLGSVMLPPGKPEVKAGSVLDGLATRQVTIRIDFAKVYDQMLDFQRDSMLQLFLTSMLRSSGKTQPFDLEKDPKLKAAAERLVRSLKMSISWLAEPKGKTMRGFGFGMNLSVDPVVGKLISPVFANGAVDFSLDMLFTYSKFGQSVSVEAPDSAIDLLPYFQNTTAA